jgi:type IV pilus assembly protein PilO
MSSRHGLKSPFLRAEKATISARYGEQPLKMKVQGDFNGYYGFLLDIERLARITRIPQMKLTKIKDEEGRLEAEFTLNIYFESQGGGEKIAHVSAERLGQR